jgi:cellulose synthase/poly-beta-1,6-N-acetylglucosamine synthase-like glycosyltransferase
MITEFLSNLISEYINMQRFIIVSILTGGATVSILFNMYKWIKDKSRAKELISETSMLPNLIETPKVSILVAAWNEEHLIERHIQSLIDLRYQNKEIIICAGGDDNTEVLARNLLGKKGFVVRQCPHEGKQKALKKCFEKSLGEIIYLTDADTILDDFTFESLLSVIIAEKEQAATGRYCPIKEQRGNPFVLMQWYQDNYQRTKSPKYVEGLIGRNAILTRGLLEHTGGFSSNAPIGTDFYLAKQITQLGNKIRYVHLSNVQTEFVESLPHYLKQQSRWLRNIIQHGLRFKAKHQVGYTIKQCLLGTALFFWPFSFPISGWAGLAIWIFLIFFITLSRFRYIRFSEITLNQPRHWQVYFFSPVYIFSDLLMLTYTLFSVLHPKHRWSW